MNPGGWDTAGAAADVDDDYDYFSETDIRPHLPLVVPRGACEPLNLHAPRPHTTGGHFIPGEFVRYECVYECVCVCVCGGVGGVCVRSAISLSKISAETN